MSRGMSLPAEQIQKPISVIRCTEWFVTHSEFTQITPATLHLTCEVDA